MFHQLHPLTEPSPRRQSEWSDYLPLSALTRLLGPDWDIYLMTVLAVLLGLVVFFRRPR